MKGIILESRGGAKKSNAQRNPDYKLLLQYTLETLKNSAAKDIEIYIASATNSKYPNLSDRLLSIDGASKIDFATIDIDTFITKLSKEIRLSGQSGTEKGGNSTKRLFFHINAIETDILPIINDVKDKDKSKSLDIKQQVKMALENFKFDFKRNKNLITADLKLQVTHLQKGLKDYLGTTFEDYQWQTEFKPDTNRKDSIDIYGYNKVLDMYIVVELDPHRADSIAKKFVSRLAMMVNNNLLYVAYLYPGTDKMPVNEAYKYLGDCETILDVLNTNSDIKKQFLGFFLEQ
ncbi:hypothetical protein KBJ98_13640 [Flavobacterium sp. F-328]|uniref:Restriction endonuclease n=1 Tax=Flavobacterium erciyesense TaxID=2825842 RepID=A0ABS5D6Y5_9FLAO|nr:hypothetical protein [Flavobacterium erciyesense]MBQ0909751.1 hypothetical protein [Flavobacterium erciyesense]